MNTEVSAVDVITQLTELHRACPNCGTLLVGARCAASPEPGQTMRAFLGLVCPQCEAVFYLDTEASA